MIHLFMMVMKLNVTVFRFLCQSIFYRFFYQGGFTENHDFQATRTRFNPNQQQYTGNYNNRNNMGHNNYPQNNGPMPTTTQVTIPHSLSPCILGPRGTRIAQIRQQSGCVIKFDDPLPSNDRIISIIGMPNNIIQAQYLMQTAVKQMD
jgi:hypothetical protein